MLRTADLPTLTRVGSDFDAGFHVDDLGAHVAVRVDLRIDEISRRRFGAREHESSGHCPQSGTRLPTSFRHPVPRANSSLDRTVSIRRGPVAQERRCRSVRSGSDGTRTPTSVARHAAPARCRLARLRHLGAADSSHRLDVERLQLMAAAALDSTIKSPGSRARSSRLERPSERARERKSGGRPHDRLASEAIVRLELGKTGVERAALSDALPRTAGSAGRTRQNTVTSKAKQPVWSLGRAGACTDVTECVLACWRAENSAKAGFS
jgi:hypothetical protein